MNRRKRGIHTLQAGFTVEAAAVFSVIFLVLILSVYVLFYYHDKMILTGAVWETASIGGERMRLMNKPDPEELEDYFQSRIQGKMIYFGECSAEAVLSGLEIRVEARAYRRRMNLYVKGSVKVTEPETYIRNGKRIREAGERFGGSL